jgi:hypothetical protein
MMGLLAVLLVVFYEVKRLKFIITVCGSDCQRGGTSSHCHVVKWLQDPCCGQYELIPWSFNFIELCATMLNSLQQGLKREAVS